MIFGTKNHNKKMNVKKIPIDKIKKGPRIRENPGNLKLFAEFITLCGLLNPITVKQEKNGYFLLAGERRLEASKLLGWKKIDAHIINQITKV